jgi:hypothetical protein
MGSARGRSWGPGAPRSPDGSLKTGGILLWLIPQPTDPDTLSGLLSGFPPPASRGHESRHFVGKAVAMLPHG